MTTHKICLPRLFLSLLCLLAVVTSIHAQQKQETAPTVQDDEDVLRISTELVQTDVVVLDKQGHFVEGLKPEQFELKVDGKPQPIAFFESVTAWTADEDAQLAAARGGSCTPTTTTKDSPAPTVVKRGRTVIFFVDDLHMSNDSMVRVRKLLLRFIDKEMDKDDLVAIASAAGSIGFLQQFTNNKAVLRAAADRLTYHPYTVGDTQRPSMSEFQAQSIDRGEPDILDTFVEQVIRENPRMPRDLAESTVRNRAGQILKQSTLVTVSMLGSLDSLMRTSTRLPGRKLAIFLSDGFALDTRNSDAQNRLRRVTTSAARAGVVIYTLDARGLVTGAPDPTQEEAFDPHGRFARATATAEISHTQDGLVTLSEDTGGCVYLNSNSLYPGLARALEEISHYYLLSWRPDPETNRGGKFRRFDVSVVGRPELKVRARRGFLSDEVKPVAKEGSGKAAAAATPAPVKTADDELRSAVNDLLPRKGVPTFLSVGYLDLPEKVAMLTVAMKVPGDALTYEQAADKFDATVDVFGGVFDDKGQPVSSFKDVLKVTAGSNDPANLRNQKVVYTSQATVKPGLYQVRVASRDAQSKRTGSATEWIEIPDLTKSGLSMSGLFISELKVGQTQTDEEALKLPNLSIDRRFAKTSKLLFLTYIYNASRGTTGTDTPDVAIQIQVLSDVKPVIRTQMLKVSTEGLTDLARLPYSAAIPLTSMPAGRYTLQLTIADRVAKTSASQSINFEIE
jgi:VWFA-related protein